MTKFSDLRHVFRDTSSRSHHARICIVTPELVEFYQNGGIGTATSGLVRVLQRLGHEVTVFYTGDIPDGMNSPGHNGPWLAGLRNIESSGVKVRFLKQEFGEHYLWPPRKTSYACFDFLKRGNFEIVHFNDFGGNGFYTTLAKKCGLFFSESTIVTTIHGTTAWAMSADMQGPSNLGQFERIYLENRSIEGSDVVVGVSRHLLEWLERHDVQLPKHTYVHKNCHPPIPHQQGVGIEPGAIKRIAFFGRMDFRKGVDIFVKAIQRFAPAHPDVEIAFLGKFGFIEGEHAAGYVLHRLRGIPNSLRFYNHLDRDRALLELRKAGTLAVMPSYDENSPCVIVECETSGIPFLTSNVGGSSELIAHEDHASALFSLSTEALEDALERVFAEGLKVARPSASAEEVERIWGDLHEAIAARDPVLAKDAGETADAADFMDGSAHPKLVSVCITHYRRPSMLPGLIETIEKQDYPNIEIVLVDDCSDDGHTDTVLSSLQQRPNQRFPVKVIRREKNGYLGAARNTAIAHASGYYVKFQDDDNLPLSTEVSAMVRAQMRTGAAVITSFAYQYSSQVPEEPGIQDIQYFPIGGCAPLAYVRNEFGDANALVLRDVCDEIGGFSEEVGVGAEDYEFFARILSAGYDVVTLPEPQFFYRVAANSMLQTASIQRDAMRARRGFKGMPPSRYAILADIVANRDIASQVNGAALARLGGYDFSEHHRSLLEGNPNSPEADRTVVELMRQYGRVEDALLQFLHANDTQGALEWMKFSLFNTNWGDGTSFRFSDFSEVDNVERLSPLSNQLPDYWQDGWQIVARRKEGIMVHPVGDTETVAILPGFLPVGARRVTVYWVHLAKSGAPVEVCVGCGSGERSAWQRLEPGGRAVELSLSNPDPERTMDLLLVSRAVAGDNSAWSVARFARIDFDRAAE